MVTLCSSGFHSMPHFGHSQLVAVSSAPAASALPISRPQQSSGSQLCIALPFHVGSHPPGYLSRYVGVAGVVQMDVVNVGKRRSIRVGSGRTPGITPSTGRDRVGGLGTGKTADENELGTDLQHIANITSHAHVYAEGACTSARYRGRERTGVGPT